MSGHMALNQSWQGIMENIFEMEKKYSKCLRQLIFKSEIFRVL